MNDEIKVQVPLGQRKYADPYIRGRNGDFEITALRIHQWAEADSEGACGTVDIHGIGKRAEPIVGGFRCIRSENIDALCKAWIEARGGLVILPSDDDVDALITVCCGIIDDSVVVSRDRDALERLGDEYVGDINPDKMEYHVHAVDLLPASQQGSQEQAL